MQKKSWDLDSFPNILSCFVYQIGQFLYAYMQFPSSISQNVDNYTSI